MTAAAEAAMTVDAAAAGGRERVRVQRGSFYVDAALYDRRFGGAEAVAVLGREGRIVLAPLRQPGSGGLLVKVRNARGDRVIHAAEALRALGVDDAADHHLEVEWDGALAALTMPNPGGGGDGRGR